MGWFSLRRKAPKPAGEPFVDVPSVGDDIELDEPELLVTQIKYNGYHGGILESILLSLGDYLEQDYDFMLRVFASIEALLIVSSERNSKGDYQGAAQSAFKAVALNNVFSEFEPRSVWAEREKGHLIWQEVSRCFYSVGDIPRAISSLDQAIDSLKGKKSQIFQRQNWEERREDLFDIFDKGTFKPRIVEITKEDFVGICSYCTEPYVVQCMEKLIAGETPIFPLHDFSRAPRINLIKLAISEGFALDEYDEFGSLPLHYASETTSVEAVSLLIDSGSDVNCLSENQWTPIMLASGTGDPEIVQLLIDAGADIFYAGLNAWTALHRAAAMGHTEVARLLIDAGADVSAVDAQGLTPKGLAVQEGYDIESIL